MDSVKITDIIPNHEKCKVLGILDEGKFKIDKVFKYGKFGTINGCGKLLEIIRKTDKENGILNFNYSA